MNPQMDPKLQNQMMQAQALRQGVPPAGQMGVENKASGAAVEQAQKVAQHVPYGQLKSKMSSMLNPVEHASGLIGTVGRLF